MPVLRFRFEKTGKAAYLSHLDVMRTFQRAFVRAEVRFRHSEGFNPHPKMSIALPLQLGCESVCEVLDAELVNLPEDPVTAVSAVLPAGLRMVEAYVPANKVSAVTHADWDLFFSDTSQAEAAEAVLRTSPLEVEKKTKRGLSTLDIAPHLEILGRTGPALSLRLRASEPTVNTGDVTKALLARQPGLQPLLCRRVALRTGDLTEFR